MEDTPTRRNSLEQGRAQEAFQAAKKGTEAFKKDYLSFVYDMPMLIKTNGLGAAIAFATYKNGASKKVYQQISEWLKKDHKQLIDLSSEELAEMLTKIPSHQYKAVTVEVMAYLNWLRRFAKGLQKD